MLRTQFNERGEKLLSTSSLDGVSVEELHSLLGRLIAKNPAIKYAPVALCLHGIETDETVITRVVNEGDDSRLWLYVKSRVENILLRGFDERTR